MIRLNLSVAENGVTIRHYRTTRPRSRSGPSKRRHMPLGQLVLPPAALRSLCDALHDLADDLDAGRTTPRPRSLKLTANPKENP